jgi:hypothetical protein
LTYHANWTNQQKDVILEETTRFEFSGTGNQRVIDRVTTLKADKTLFLKMPKMDCLACAWHMTCKCLMHRRSKIYRR